MGRVGQPAMYIKPQNAEEAVPLPPDKKILEQTVERNIRIAPGVKARLPKIGGYPGEDFWLNQNFSISSKVLPLVSGTPRQTKRKAATETAA